MPYIPSEVVEQARQIDLLTYLRKFEPDNVEEVKGTRNVYRTVDHDSLKMSNGKWFWWSQGFGGYNALDYLIKSQELFFYGRSGNPYGKRTGKLDAATEKKKKKLSQRYCVCRKNIKTVNG